MKKLALVLPLLALAAAADPAEPLVARSYPVLPIIDQTMVIDCGWEEEPNGLIRISKESDTEISTADWLKGYTAKRGVTWPEGSAIEWVPIRGEVRAFNTEANHAILRDIVAQWQRQAIRTSEQFVSATPEAFEELGLEDVLGATLAPEEWAALRARLAAHPGVELCDCATSLTCMGAQAMTRGVAEVIYPTEFLVEPFHHHP